MPTTNSELRRRTTRRLLVEHLQRVLELKTIAVTNRLFFQLGRLDVRCKASAVLGPPGYILGPNLQALLLRPLDPLHESMFTISWAASGATCRLWWNVCALPAKMNQMHVHYVLEAPY